METLSKIEKLYLQELVMNDLKQIKEQEGNTKNLKYKEMLKQCMKNASNILQKLRI